MITAHAVAMQHASQRMSLRLLKACKAWYCIGFFERILKSIRYLHALHALHAMLSSTLASCGFQFQAAGAPTLATSDDVTDLDLDQSSTISADIPVIVMREIVFIASSKTGVIAHCEMCVLEWKKDMEGHCLCKSGLVIRVQLCHRSSPEQRTSLGQCVVSAPLLFSLEPSPAWD